MQQNNHMQHVCEKVSYLANGVMLAIPAFVVIVQDSANGNSAQPLKQVIVLDTPAFALMTEPFTWPRIAGWSNGAE